MLGHRDVSADREGVLVEAEDRFLVVGAAGPGEGPLIAAMTDQRAVLVGRALPESPDAAMVLFAGPTRRVELSLSIERRGEFIAAARMAVRKLRRPGKLQANALQGHGILRRDPDFSRRSDVIPLICINHVASAACEK